jgi:formylglycine-generating enzyme required for sulfatase activity
MEPITILIAVALAQGLVQVGEKLLEKGVVEPALEPATEELKRLVQRGYQKAKKDRALLNAVEAALTEAGAPADDEDDLRRWLKAVSLDRLTAGRSDALRRQVARDVLAFTKPDADPPEDLVVALGWPRSQRQQLSQLLDALRAQLYALDDWRAPIEYANEAAKLGLLGDVLDHLARLDNVFVETEAGEALRVFVVQQGLTAEEAAEIETRYRADLVRELRMHDFRGIVQMRRDIRLPLADIYLELGLLSLGGDEERRRAQERLLALDQAERLAEEERRLQDRVSDALARSQRLVILGEPGSGKTISLRFIALMLAHGYGAARLSLGVPYIPLMVRLADFARELEQTPALSLDNFLLQVIEQAYASHPRLGQLLHWALEKGTCMVLLDGLEDDPLRGQPLRTSVVRRVQQFADRWCAADRPNRLVVTSRIEGYWDEALHGFDHVELSRLRPPDEVCEFLLRWYAAHEWAHDPTLSLEVAERRAEALVAELLPRLMAAPSVRRLATNPLLLTILALIHENVGKLPNRRIRLYEICAQTLIESWRRAQTGLPSELLADLGEETVIRMMAPLAHWLHEDYPGGTASFQEWNERLLHILREQEGYEAEEAGDIAHRFLHHARYETGLLAERGLGQFGFFHLTFEEYLAAREMARQRVEKRREMLRTHWQDPRWHEVILLAAGQLGIIEAKKDDVSDLLVDLLEMEPADLEDAGRQVVLAGRALADIGRRSVTRPTWRWVRDALRQTMQDLDPDTGHPNDPPRMPVRTRYTAGEVLDELDWLPEDLNAWGRCPGCAEDGGDLLAMKYPVTNAQFERFIQAGGYGNPDYWGGEKSEGWQWRLTEHPDYRGKGSVTEPEYWHNPRFGKERSGYPIVGVSWYEAAAYAAWLTDVLRSIRDGDADLSAEDRALVADLLEAGAAEVRLPIEGEWERMAGGAADKDRYPWDPPQGPATRNEADILARANTSEADLSGTSPVAMYPLGASRPFGLMDLAGNVWEWTGSWYREGVTRVLRGGSWGNLQDGARCAYRYRSYPSYSISYFGFRLVSPVASGC